ncbi:MAG: DUF3160 domain-containing protein [Dehalococcoidia bacterium]|nr:MAG: DUF3160 domain-containing protein [Dehalococcoidia bacterium]
MKLKLFASLVLVVSVLVSGCAEKSATPTTLTVPSVAAGEISNPKLVLASLYSLEGFSVTLDSPSYSLPLDLTEITNLQNIESRFQLNSNQRQLLRDNGFVAIPSNGDDIVEPYKSLKEQEVPIFVTTDTLLHLYHIQFNETLKRIEEEEFFDQILDMSKAMLESSIEDYESFSDADLKEAARRNTAYFAVALTLLQTPTEGYDEEKAREEIEKWNRQNPWDKKEFVPIRTVDFDVPNWIKDDVDKEIAYIEAHQDFKPSAIFNTAEECSCLAAGCYCEDYTQYVPRGHYTRSETLKRYFKAMMWYGRMAFLLKGGDGALISEEDADLATIQASLISVHLPDVQVNEATAKEIWDRIYLVTAFYVGTADDLTPYEYLSAIDNVFGTEFQASELADDEKLLNLKAELAQMRNPEIYGGSGICVILPPITKEKLYECLAETKGMRFMGQRFIPDSYMFQNLVSPAVGMYVGDDEPFTMKMTGAGPARTFPRGLDVMAVLGSERAYEILEEEGDTEYEGKDTSYDKQLAELRGEFDEFGIADWNRNLYWAWLYALKPLLQEFGDGYPTFMQTQAWQDRELQAALASWTELRHDTILYAKQSYTPPLAAYPPPPKPIVGYVEPVPEFYARLLALTQMTREGLAQLNALNETESSRLQSLERMLARLIDISRDELENKELSEADYEFIRDFGEQLDSIVAGVEAEGKETTLVADVHTDINPPSQVLEEGVGYVDLILVAYMVPDGRIIIGAGPVLSYYEFKHPMDDRLTDEAWREMLEQGNEPQRPAWVGSFYAE